jgi:hypothetical protein
MRLPRLRAGTSLRRAGTHLSGARKNGMEKGVLLSKSEFGRFYMSQGLEEVCGNVGGDVVKLLNIFCSSAIVKSIPRTARLWSNI